MLNYDDEPLTLSIPLERLGWSPGPLPGLRILE